MAVEPLLLPNLCLVSRELNKESLFLVTELNLESLMLRGLFRVVRGLNLVNLELSVVVVAGSVVICDLNLVLDRVLRLGGDVGCSNLEEARERDLLLLDRSGTSERACLLNVECWSLEEEGEEGFLTELLLSLTT